MTDPSSTLTIAPPSVDSPAVDTASVVPTAARHVSSGRRHVSGGERPAYTWAIETTSLTKRFGAATVVDQLDLRVPAGSVFGFLGPNGSGKTTTIRMLLGLISPTAGQVRLLGEPIPASSASVLPRIGAMVEGPAFYPWLSGRQNLARIDAAASGSKKAGRTGRIDDALARVGLTAAGNKRVKAYSLGMRQRLGLAMALIDPCELLILDEPTNGMDPQGTREIRHLVRDLALDGTTVCLSSHLLAEIEQVCTHVAVMRLGKLLAQCSLQELRATSTETLRVTTPDTSLAQDALRAYGIESTVDDESHLHAIPGQHQAEDLCRVLVDAGVRVRDFRLDVPTLEDTFVALTGEGFDVAQ